MLKVLVLQEVSLPNFRVDQLDHLSHALVAFKWSWSAVFLIGFCTSDGGSDGDDICELMDVQAGQLSVNMKNNKKMWKLMFFGQELQFRIFWIENGK